MGLLDKLGKWQGEEKHCTAAERVAATRAAAATAALTTETTNPSSDNIQVRQQELCLPCKLITPSSIPSGSESCVFENAAVALAHGNLSDEDIIITMTDAMSEKRPYIVFATSTNEFAPILVEENASDGERVALYIADEPTLSKLSRIAGAGDALDQISLEVIRGSIGNAAKIVLETDRVYIS